MSDHLSQARIENYRLGRLAPDDLLGADDHLAGCEECRRRLEASLGGAAEMELYARLSAGADPVAHLTFEQSAAYVDGALTGDDRQTVKDHLASCARCAEAVDDLRVFRNEVAPELDREYTPKKVAPRRTGRVVIALPSPFLKIPLWVYAASPILLLLAAAGWMAWRATLKPVPPQIAVTSPKTAQSPSINVGSPPPSPTPLLVRLNDGGSAVTLDAQGRLMGVERWPLEYRHLAQEALSRQRVERSPLLAGLSRPGSSLMGGDDRDGRFAVIEPAGKVVLTDRPTFHWSELSGATGYVVEIYDARFELASTSPSLTSLSWTSPPLARGQVYSWQVRATREGREFIAPHPTAPQARFRILDQATAAEIARARRDHASSHLLLGLLYARAGLIAEAGQEFRALQKANPDSEVARKLLASASALRR